MTIVPFKDTGHHKRAEHIAKAIHHCFRVQNNEEDWGEPGESFAEFGPDIVKDVDVWYPDPTDNGIYLCMLTLQLLVVVSPNNIQRKQPIDVLPKIVDDLDVLEEELLKTHIRSCFVAILSQTFQGGTSR